MFLKTRVVVAPPARHAPHMTRKVRIHDGVIAVLLLTSAALGTWVDPRGWWLTPLTALIMLQSAFTGFCPVHFSINKLLRD